MNSNQKKKEVLFYGPYVSFLWPVLLHVATFPQLRVLHAGGYLNNIYGVICGAGRETIGIGGLRVQMPRLFQLLLVPTDRLLLSKCPMLICPMLIPC